VNWHEKASKILSQKTKRPIRIRAHPGRNEATVPLEKDLEGAWACVIWSSSSGIKSLQLGVPVYFDAPYWIAEVAALRFDSDIENPKRNDLARELAFQKMSWAQWTIEELESGEPFSRFRQAIESGSLAKC